MYNFFPRTWSLDGYLLFSFLLFSFYRYYCAYNLFWAHLESEVYQQSGYSIFHLQTQCFIFSRKTISTKSLFFARIDALMVSTAMRE